MVQKEALCMTVHPFANQYDLCRFIQVNGGVASLPQVCGTYPANATHLSENVRAAYVQCSNQVSLYADTNSCNVAAAQVFAQDSMNSPVGITTLGYVFWQGMRLVHRSIVTPGNPRQPYRHAIHMTTNVVGGGVLMVGAYAFGGVPALVAALGMAIIYGVSNQPARRDREESPPRVAPAAQESHRVPNTDECPDEDKKKT